MYLKRLILPALLVCNLIIQAQNTPSYLPTNGLVGWWPFSGNAIDSSGAGNNGTAVNTILANDRFGKANSAYSYNGVNSRIDIPDATSLRCRKITISVWVFNNNITRLGQIVFKSSLSAAGEGYSVFCADSYITSGVKIGSNCAPGVGWKVATSKGQVSQVVGNILCQRLME